MASALLAWGRGEAEWGAGRLAGGQEAGGTGGETPENSRGEDEPGPPPGVTARVEKGFFEDSLVRRQEEGVQEAGLPAPQARALPGRKIKIRRIILRDCHGDASADGGQHSSRHATPFVFLTTALEAGASTPGTLGETGAAGTPPSI